MTWPIADSAFIADAEPLTSVPRPLPVRTPGQVLREADALDPVQFVFDAPVTSEPSSQLLIADLQRGVSAVA